MTPHPLLALLVLSAATALAAAPVAANGFYLHGQVGLAEPDAAGFDDDTAVALAAGWQFHRHFAIEAGYNDFGDLVASGPVIGGPARLSADSFQLGIAAWWPFGRSRTSGVLRAGAHRWDADVSNPELGFDDRGTDPYLGIGIAVALTDRFALTLSVDRYRLDDGDIDRAMAGATWRF